MSIATIIISSTSEYPMGIHHLLVNCVHHAISTGLQGGSTLFTREVRYSLNYVWGVHFSQGYRVHSNNFIRLTF